MKRILPVLLCVLLLSSCAGGAALQTDPDSITFTDALGREVTVDKNPQRVAALLGSFADIWTLAGGTLCAAAEDAWEDFGLETEAANIGGAHTPNLELLLAADPELVIASASTASNVEMLQTLQAAGITTAYFDVDNFTDYLHMLDICTDITGRKDLYEQNGLQLQADIEQLKAQYADADIPPQQRTVLMLRASSSSVKAKGSSGTVLGEMLADMGCVNIADHDTTLLESLSVEAVIRQQPHHIFVVTMGSDTAAAQQMLQSLFAQNPAWGTLEAAQQGRVYLMEKSLFNLKPNARWAEAYEQLYETLIGE